MGINDHVCMELMNEKTRKDAYVKIVRNDGIAGHSDGPLAELNDDEVYDLIKAASSPAGARIMARRVHRELVRGTSGKTSTTSGKTDPDVERRKSVNDKFDVNSRYKFIGEFARMAITQTINSLIVTGDGGLGKTFAVNSKLRHLTVGKDFLRVKGHCTPKALFNLLRDNPNSLIVFDDCDAPLLDKTSLNILKSALDSDERWVHWETTRAVVDGEAKEDTSFEFRGTCIFISNLPFDSIDQAILSRSIFVDVTMTADEKITRMATILPHLKVENPIEERREVLKLMNDLRHDIKDLNIRTLTKCLEIRRSPEVSDWKWAVEYILRMGIGEK